MHNTSIGGFFSLLIGILIAYLGYTNLYLMFTYTNPSLNVVQSTIDFDKLGTINYDDINILLFYRLMDSSQ
jgi:hypothetical protein